MRVVRPRVATLFSILAIVVTMFAFGTLAEAQQQKKIPRIGYLGTNPAPGEWWDALLNGLRELGYSEGRNLVFERRFSEGNAERFPKLAAEMVQLRVDLILVHTTPAAIAAKRATQTIPIVFPTAIDPVGTGLVASLARPGGNLTGLSSLAPELSGKRLELLKEVVPGVARVAVLWNPANPANAAAWHETQTAAGALGLMLHAQDVRSPQDLEGAFARTARAHPDALVVLQDSLITMHRQHIVEFVTQQHLPSIFSTMEWVVTGGLMSYGPNFPDLNRRAATYVDKILKGAKPADLPVEQPTKFEFMINLKTAKQIGVTVPPNMLARADRVIR